MEVQEIKEQLKEIFRTVINNDKWITKYDKEGEPYHVNIDDTDSKEEKYEIPKDYKDSVKGYSKEKHEQAADFYGEKMATVQKKSVAHPDNEDYRKQFEEYKALKDYHEEKAKSDSKGEKASYKFAIVQEIPYKRIGELRKNQTNLPTRLKELALGDSYEDLEKYIKENNLQDVKIMKREDDTEEHPKEDKKEDKEKYKLKEGSKVTQKRFDDLFDNGSYLENHQYRKTIVLDNTHQVEFDKKRGLITFYEQGDLSESKNYNAPKGTKGMLQKFKTDDYNKLVDYLFDNNEQWRFERNKANNDKEQEMALIEELKKLITKVENTKGEKDMEIENEKVDKRKLIDEVAGIMKSAGCDDEDIRTAIGKMEKIGYDDSEKSADNCGGKKVKNEEKEPEKDEKEVKEVKEEVKEDVENKCKNAKEDYFAKLNEIYNAASQAKEEVDYTSRVDREKAAEDYFAK